MKHTYGLRGRAFRLLLCAALMLGLMSTMLLPCYAELDEPIVLDDCEVSTWHGSTGKDYAEFTEGRASVSWTVPVGGHFVVHRDWSTPVDATGANYLEFDIYVSSADMFYSISGGNSLEVTSGGTCDVEETSWNLTDLDVVDGWNHISLPIGGGCDWSRINYMRFYALSHNNTEAYTIKIDNIQCVWNDPEDVGGFDIPDDYVIGTQTADTAVPVIPTSEDSGTTGEGGESTDTDNKEQEPDVEVKAPPVLGIVMLCVAGVVLLVLLVLVAIKKANKVVIIVLCVVAVVAVVLGAVGFVTSGKEPSADDDGDKPVTGDDGDADDDGEQLSPEQIPTLMGDQTGHPEVSAETVNVEELLRVDPNFDPKEEYKVRYEGGSFVVDFSTLPHVVMSEVPQQSGLLFEAVLPDMIQKLTIVEKECWMFEHFRTQDTNKFYVSLDDAATATYAGKNIRLTFVTYVNADTTYTVEYNGADGEKKTVTSAANSIRNAWTEYHVDIPAPALDGGMNGHDFFIKCEGPELIRVSAMYVDEASANPLTQTGLIKTDYEQSFYIIAEENVRAHGAQGNGMTDDTKAFKSAIAAVGAKGGGTVFVPAGYYCLTEPLVLPSSVALVGEIEPGTANGTVLCIYHGKGLTDPDQAAVVLNHQSSVQSLAFWYPEQTLVNGSFIPYPSTITQRGSEGVTVRNVTFINSYFGINYGTLGGGQSSNSLQYTRDIYGTCLSLGYHNDPSYDIGKLENFHFSPDYWLNSGLPGTPNEELLRTWMLRNSTGIWLQRIDWTYIADIYVDGYHKGIYTSLSSTGTPNGHMYNINLLDCYYPYYAQELSWTIASKCHFRAVGNDGATALYFGPNCGGDMVFVDAVIESAGANAIANYGSSQLSLTGCTVTSEGTAYANMKGSKAVFVNTTLTGSDNRDYDVVTEKLALTLPDVDYGKTVELKPKSDVFINLTEAPYNAKKNADITETLQKAIDDLKETGGIVYLPAGTYAVSGHIDVWAGVELRGAAIWAHSFTSPTCINTSFGQNDPDGKALFDLYDGAGMIGISVVYNQQNTNALQPYSFTIRGRGSDIYLMDVTLPTSWNGVDFASYRCDNHYIEYLHGCFLNQGIVVGGGSENGIVRDCHFTPNCFAVHTDSNWWTGPYVSIMTRGTPFVVGESKNQILYHNFTYGAYQGLTVLDGAKDVYVLSHGVDSGDISAYFSGDCSVTLVNAELVNLHTAGTAKHFNYVYTDEDFTGTLNMINTAGWGTSKNAFNLSGEGEINVTGAKIVAAGAPLVQLNGGEIVMIGLINDSRTTDFKASLNGQAIHVSGNLFNSGLRFDSSIDENGIPVSGEDLSIYNH